MEYLLLFLLTIVTIALGKIGKRFGLSEVVGQLLSGIFLGTSFLNIVHPSNLIHLIAEVGVFLLMLNSGLESDLKEMKKYIKASSTIAVAGVLFPLIAFPITFLLFGYSVQASIFAGVVFSATSISITLAVLAEQKKLATKIGAIILSAAVLDDIIALVAVTLFSIFVGGGTLGINNLLPLFAFALGLILRKYDFAERLGFLSTKSGNYFFYPVFFGSIGLEVAVQDLNNKLPAIVLFSLLAVITKFYGSYVGARLSGLDTNMANAIGSGMISRGEMALVIIQIGISSKIINDDISSEFIVAVIISTIVAPIIMKPLFKKV
ncbi:Kef-type K+ transport system, membrane component [Weissella koreensis KACC 15510]|uniref:cation:proton antiporter n=1 Tax=Weissella koreensis TaxID=165096 RepID=UPI000217504A|nr:cation:proton antiporter [Weissella koreensis]AEJ23937.1 Kef-type K+ transport system, membrane component [Weissella koreensis KACC 15510]